VAVSPIRAVLIAHLQASYNRSRKDMGAMGSLIAAIAVGFLALFAALPMLGGGLVGGYALGTKLNEPGFALILGGILTVLAVVGGVAAGISGGTKALTWESYRGFPLRPRTLFAAELVAGLGEIWTIILVSLQAALLVGVGVAHPSLIPLLLLLLPASILAMLLMQHLMGSLAEALVKRLRAGLIVLGILAWLGSLLPSFFLPHGKAKGAEPSLSPEQLEMLKSLGRGIRRVAEFLPASQACKGLTAALNGAWGRALLLQVFPLLLVSLLAWIAFRILEREAQPTASQSVGKHSPERLWSFASPAMGVGRLHWQSLIGSHFGKFALLIPLMTLVILKGPFGHMKGQNLWAMPSAFAYLALTAGQLQHNQFGLDGHGVKALLLLPISARELLLGKFLGLAFLQLLQASLFVLLASFAYGLNVSTMVASLALGICFFALQTGLGHWSSAWLPRTIPRNKLRNNAMPMPVLFLSFGLTGTCTALFGGIYALLLWLAPGLLAPGMLLLAGGCLAAYWYLALPGASRFLERRREKLVEILG